MIYFAYSAISSLYDLEDELPDDILQPTGKPNVSETNGIGSSGSSDSIASGQICSNDDNNTNRSNNSNNNEVSNSAPSTPSSNQMTPPVTGIHTSLYNVSGPYGNSNFSNGTANINCSTVNSDQRIGQISSAVPVVKTEPDSYEKPFSMVSMIGVIFR